MSNIQHMLDDDINAMHMRLTYTAEGYDLVHASMC